LKNIAPNRAAKKLQEKVKINTCVIRSGKQKKINTSLVVRGDIIFLNAGDMIPADACLLQADDLFVDQSALTGESYPCEKTAHINPANLEQRILYGGTNVVSGQALAIVIRTGKNTEFGTIAANLTRPEPKSEFEIGAAKFSFFIALIVSALGCAASLYNIFSSDLGYMAALGGFHKKFHRKNFISFSPF